MSPMVVLGIVQAVVQGIQAVRNLVEKDIKLRGEFLGGLDFIKGELEMVQADILASEQQELLLQELAYDIEDFVQGLWELSPSGSFILSVLGMDPRPGDLGRINAYKERIKSLRDWQQRSSETTQRGAGSTATSGLSSPGSPYTEEEYLVGIAQPKDEILRLLLPGEGQRRVISIVGCSGIGKTALARAVYDHHAGIATNEFDCVAWVVASKCTDAEDLLNKVLQEVGGTASGKPLQDFLQDKRYLVFIDDMRPQGVLWEHIENAFPENDKDSRIIVTTNTHSVARNCSSGRYYVCTMQCLDEANSESLFWRKVYKYDINREPSPALVVGSKSILTKCHGLPLALISAANCLCGNTPDPLRADCENVGKELGRCLEVESAFGEMEKSLVRCYQSLPDNDHKKCLLYASIFPRHHQINSNSLARRLIAEGLIGAEDIHQGIVEELDSVRKCLEKLVDQSMIEAAQISNKTPKRYHVHSIMLEFTMRKSLHINFLSLLHNKKELYNINCNVRRLTVQFSSSKVECDAFLQKKVRSVSETRLSTVRSLTIFKSEVPDLKGGKVLRVLDLEGCDGINKRVLHEICELLYLKYLSLRKTDVGDLPSEMKNLIHLQTLDIRETQQVIILPVEVIILPELVYLFGMFELPELAHRDTEVAEFLKKKSKLHTLAGIVIQGTQGFKIIIQHARELKKVKIWCKDATPSSTSLPPAAAATTAFTFPPAAAAASPSSTSPPPAVATVPRSTHGGWFRRLYWPCGVIDQHRYPARKSQIRSRPATKLPSNGTASSRGVPPPPSSSHLVASSGLASILVSSLEGRSAPLESLSIASTSICNNFLNSLRAPCNLSSFKLRGELERLPGPATLEKLRNLNKLHLFSTGLRSEQLVVLQRLRYLEYLKLAEERNGYWDCRFLVKADGFPSLKEMCFQASMYPLLCIEEGAMCSLTSLQLLCPESPVPRGASTESALGVEGIDHLEKLSEIILHHSATVSKIEAWKEAAKVHINMPYVKKLSEPAA